MTTKSFTRLAFYFFTNTQGSTQTDLKNKRERNEWEKIINFTANVAFQLARSPVSCASCRMLG